MTQWIVLSFLAPWLMGVVGETPALDQALASRFAKLSLDCTDRPWPNKPSHVYESDSQVRPPRQDTPAFYGCYDWHSAVHGHWAMLRILRRFPDLPEAAAIRVRLNAHLSKENLAAELAFFQQERNATFERPYGWGWFLRLQAELEVAAKEDKDAARWAAATRPMARFLSVLLQDYLKRLSVSVRAGTHNNTAFALVHAIDYANAVDDRDLLQAVRQAAMRFYAKDKNCPTAYEPSGEDFISPCLAEADLMGRVLSASAFRIWLKTFLPAISSTEFAPLAQPVEVRDRHDPRIGHLIGLALQRAWCYAGLARRMPSGSREQIQFEALATKHRRAGLRQMFDSGYGGHHWLASFAIYLMTL